MDPLAGACGSELGFSGHSKPSIAISEPIIGFFLFHTRIFCADKAFFVDVPIKGPLGPTQVEFSPCVLGQACVRKWNLSKYCISRKM
jgi:hypothetical protein